MPEFHAAVVHPEDETPDTYCGIVSQEYVDGVLAACVDHPDRWVKPGRGGGVYILREDGDLDHYLPVDEQFAVGGALRSGVTIARNTSDSPVPILTAEQHQALRDGSAD